MNKQNGNFKDLHANKYLVCVQLLRGIFRHNELYYQQSYVLIKNDHLFLIH